MTICQTLLKESCKKNCVDVCDCYQNAPAVTLDQTMKTFLSRRKYKNFQDPEHLERATKLMLEFYSHFEKEMCIWPIFGTLLGIVRQDSLIPHDDDIDFGFFSEDIEKLEEILTHLHKEKKFVVIRNQFKTIYTVCADDVFIDLYSYTPSKNEGGNCLAQGHRHFYNILNNETYPFKKIKFKGLEFNCISKPEKWLERFYGKDWKTPK